MSRAGEVEARPPAEIIISVSLRIYTQMIVIFTCSQVNIDTDMGSVVKSGMKPSIPYTQL